jgi:hypothetical protein
LSIQPDTYHVKRHLLAEFMVIFDVWGTSE